jgi:histidyl-tRNA synthetase
MPKHLSPPATRDYLPSDAAARNHVRNCFSRVAESYGFQPIETPSFESAELFLARSGPEIRNSMLTFHCDHEEFALRPEMTAPVCRLVASSPFGSVPRPYKLYYIGSCFRYCPPRSGRYREFTQAGIECLGEAGSHADAEVIATACGILRDLGIGTSRLRIGSIGIFSDLLPTGLDSEDRATVIGHLDKLLDIDEKCAFLARTGDRIVFEQLKLDRFELASWQAEADYDGPFRISGQSMPSPAELAAHLPQEAEATLRRLWDVEELASEAVSDLLIRVSRLRGPLQKVHEEARQLLNGTPAMDSLERLLAVCRHVETFGAGEFDLVLGIARGFTFYTSTVFEITTEAGAQKLCGGGRYDRLVEEFGGPSLPSTGCAFRFDALVEAFVRSRGWQAPRPYQLLFVVNSQDAWTGAVGVAEQLRRRGLRVGVEFGPQREPTNEDRERLGADWVALLSAEALARREIHLSGDGGGEQAPLDAQALSDRLAAPRSSGRAVE